MMQAHVFSLAFFVTKFISFGIRNVREIQSEEGKPQFAKYGSYVMINRSFHVESLINSESHYGMYCFLDRIFNETRKLRRKVSFLALTAFIVLSLADLILTKTLLIQSGGDVYEANPLANMIIMQWGWGALTVFKLSLVGLVSGIVLYVGYFRPLTAKRLLHFALTLMTALVSYSLCLLVYIA